MRFTDKVVLVTGAASGIGLATALRFGLEGAKVALVDRDAAALPTASAALRSHGAGEPLELVCDVGDERQAGDTVGRVLAHWGRLDVVVNNAGLMLFAPLDQLTGDDWLKVLRVDLLGAFYFTKQAFLHMQPGGAIVNLASVHALETEPNVAPYAAAKAALLSLTRSSAIEAAPKGIRVNAVLPGAVDTPMLWNNPQVKSGAEQLDRGEVGKPEDIAAAVAFLASSDAAFVQGASLLVDGGRLCRL